MDSTRFVQADPGPDAFAATFILVNSDQEKLRNPRYCETTNKVSIL